MAAKVLFFDIETAPETAYIWNRFDTTVGQTQIKEPGYLLCISWAWNNEEPQTLGIYKGRNWNRGDRTNDERIVKKAWDLFNEADIIIGHNVLKFDIATLNARFIYHHLPPPSPYKVCDTYKLLKKYFQMPSKSLESSSIYFGIDVKEKQPFTLWRDCMLGKSEAWERILSYCAHDVHVVRQLYYKLRPFASNHPNMNLYSDEKDVCPKCGHSHLVESGVSRTSTNEYKRFVCPKCGGWCRSRIVEKKDNKIKLVNVA